MADISFEHADDARTALRAVVSDPAHGSDALSSPQIMSNLLQDLLPDAPREVGLIVAAASAGLPVALREHVAHGMGVEVAIGLAASSLAARTAFTPAACAWVATELAIALDLASPDIAVAVPDLGEVGAEDAGTWPEYQSGDTMPAAPIPARAGSPVPLLAQTQAEAPDAGLLGHFEPVPSTAPIGAPPPGPPSRRMGPAALVGVSIVVAGAVVAGGIVLASRSSPSTVHHGTSGTPSTTGSGSPTTGTTSPAAPLIYHVTQTLNPGTQGSMTQVAWTPNSKVVATSDKDGHIYLWDPSTGNELGQPLTASGGKAFCAAISPDGSTLAAGFSNGSTYLWNIATRKLMATLPDPGPAAGKQVDSVAFSPDGHILVSADGNGNAYVWHISPSHQSSTPIRTLQDPVNSGVWSATFSADGTLATGDYKGNIYLWNVGSGSYSGPIVIPGGIPITALAFSPVGNVLAAGSGSGSAGDMYLFSTNSEASQFLASPGPVWAMSFAGKTLAAADGNGKTYLWNVSPAGLTATSTGTLLDPNSGSQGVGALDFSPNGKWLVTGDTNGRAFVWAAG